MSSNIRQILVPIDGSEGSLRALDFAVSLGAAHGATLDVVTVLDLGQIDIYDGLHLNDEQLAEWQERVRMDVLDRAEEHIGKEAAQTASFALLRGSTVRTLLKYIESSDVDMVVVGQTGKNAVDRFLMGSVSGALSRRCPVPVTIIH